MRAVLLYSLQVILASGLLYGYYHFFLRNRKFHQYNRFYVLASVIISVCVPFLNIPLYFEETELQSSVVLQTLQTISSPGAKNELLATPAATQSISAPFNWNIALYLVYTFAAVFLFIRILMSIKKIRRIIRTHPVEELEGIRFVNTGEPGTPYSFFRWLFWNNKIELRSATGEQIFRHEIFHIQQRHSFDIIFMELLTSALWINPFFHLMKRELKAIHEFLADQFASDKTEKWEYAELLLMQALNTKQQLVNPFFHNQIKRRIAMITNPEKTSHRYLRKILVLPVAAFILTLFAFKYKNRNHEPVIASKDPITIVVDAAHGGIDPGVRSPGDQYTEAQLNLKLAKGIQSLASEYNVNVIMTRVNDQLPEGATSIRQGLINRVNIINRAKPFAAISVHMNANLTQGSNENSGFEGYITSQRSNVKDQKLASIVLGEMAGVYKTETNSKQRDEAAIFVLDKSNCPSVVLECGYITNKNDLAFIVEPKNQEKIARAILSGIVKYSNETKTTGSTNDSPLPANNVEWQTANAKNSFLFSDTPAQKPLLVIDGVVFGNIDGFNRLDSTIKPDQIESINVYKGKQATDKYGNKGKWGVIEIFTKKNHTPKIVDITIADQQPYTDDNKIFEKVEIEPSFPGGYAAWRKFLERNVSPNVPVQNGAPLGTYTVYVEFVVNKDGSISNVRPLTNHGFGMEKEAVRVIQEGPSWVPALQNGKEVNAYKKQPITFQVADEATFEETANSQHNNQKKVANDPNTVTVVAFSNKVFEKVEIEPAFPGGESAWREFLKRNLDVSVPETNKAAPGEYTVYVQFIVHMDGSITDIRPLTNHGFGMENEAIRVISNGPRWLPAIQNGHTVNAYRKQPVNFIVGASRKSISIYNGTGTQTLDPRTLYIGVDNSLVAEADGIDMKNVMATISQGNIKKDGNHFIARVNSVGKATVSFYTIENGRKINLKDLGFNIANLPPKSTDWIPSGPKSAGLPNISVADLKKLSVYDLLKIDRGTEIVSFTFAIDNIANNITEFGNYGNQFSALTVETMKNAHAGNTIVVENIRVKKNNAEAMMPAQAYNIID